MKKLVVLGALALATSALAAPKVDTSARKHPNIEAAQRLIGEAWDKVVAAQQANEFDMGGHAQKAKDLLDQASKELKLAAEAANVGAK